MDPSSKTIRAIRDDGSCENMHVFPARQFPVIKYLSTAMSILQEHSFCCWEVTHLQRVLLVSWLNLQSALAQCPLDRKYLHTMLLFAWPSGVVGRNAGLMDLPTRKVRSGSAKLIWGCWLSRACGPIKAMIVALRSYPFDSRAFSISSSDRSSRRIDRSISYGLISIIWG